MIDGGRDLSGLESGQLFDAAFLAAARFAARMALSSDSPARRHAKHVEPHTSPQPVGSAPSTTDSVSTFPLSSVPPTPANPAAGAPALPVRGAAS